MGNKDCCGEKECCDEKDSCCYDWSKGLGKWYSWDTPTGLSIGLAITLTSVGFFIFLLHAADLI